MDPASLLLHFLDSGKSQSQPSLRERAISSVNTKRCRLFGAAGVTEPHSHEMKGLLVTANARAHKSMPTGQCFPKSCSLVIFIMFALSGNHL